MTHCASSGQMWSVENSWGLPIIIIVSDVAWTCSVMCLYSPFCKFPLCCSDYYAIQDKIMHSIFFYPATSLALCVIWCYMYSAVQKSWVTPNFFIFFLARIHVWPWKLVLKAFWRFFKADLWTLAAFVPSFSPSLVPNHFQRKSFFVFFLFNNLLGTNLRLIQA